MAGYPLASAETRPQQIVNAVRALQAGQCNFAGTVTLLANVGSTVVSTPIAGVGQLPFLFPQTAHAAAEWISGNLFAPPVTIARTFTIFHTNSAVTGRTFSWILVG